jgi:hypothetical protein
MTMTMYVLYHHHNMLSRAKIDRFIQHTLGTHSQTTLVCNNTNCRRYLLLAQAPTLHSILFTN